MFSLFCRSRITPSPIKSQELVTELSDEFRYLPAEILSTVQVVPAKKNGNSRNSKEKIRTLTH